MSAEPLSRPSRSAPGATAGFAPRVRRGAALVAGWNGPLLAGIALMLTSWFTWAPLQPGPGLDPSWGAGLHMAAHDHLAFGRDLVFTYGPLGFLKVPTLWFRDTGAFALAYRLVLHTALGAALYVGLRRTFGPLPTLLIALVVASTIDEAAPVIVMVWGAVLLTRDAVERRHVDAFIAGVAVLGALEALGRLNIGITVLLMGAVTLLALPGRARHLAWFAGSTAVAALVLWTAAGQPWSALWDFARNGVRIVLGYSAAMAIDEPGRQWEYGAALAITLAGVGAAWELGGRQVRGARLGLIALWLVLAFTSFKQAFVRHDTHGVFFFATTLGGLCAFAWRPGRRAVGVAVLGLAFVALLGSSGASLTDIVRPLPAVRDVASDVATIVDAQRFDRTARAGREEIARASAIDPAVLRALRGRTVHVAPWDTAVAWAYGLRWRPLPVFQDYQAYTAGLDRANSDVLASARAPERILYRAQLSIDGRYAPFDTPLATRVMLCRYRPLRWAGPWVALARGPDRCGAPSLIGSVQARWGQPVTVPRPHAGALVFVRVQGAGAGIAERVRSLLYKGHERTIVFNGAQQHRLIADVAGDGLPLRSAAHVDYPAPFAQVPQAATVAIGRAGLRGARGTPLRFDFYEQPIAVTAAPGARRGARR